MVKSPFFNLYHIRCSSDVVYPASCCGKVNQQTVCGYLCTKCKNVITPNNLNLTCQLEPSTFRTSPIMPFTLHYDIYNNTVLTATLPNKQLNTLVGQLFAVEIKGSKSTSNDVYEFDIPEAAHNVHLYLPGLNCHIVRKNKTTNITQYLYDAQIVSVTRSLLTVKITKMLCKTDDFVGNFVTIGKTSSVTSAKQMRWTCLEVSNKKNYGSTTTYYFLFFLGYDRHGCILCGGCLVNLFCRVSNKTIGKSANESIWCNTVCAFNKISSNACV